MTAVAGTVLDLRDVASSIDDHTGRRWVLAGVDLAIAAGEVVALVGPSGSGKTTLLTIVAGFERPDRGQVTVSGCDPAGGEALPWSTLAMLPQSLGLLPELTVAENVGLPGRLGAAAGDGADLLARLGLGHLAPRLPGEISLGEQQRTALARAAVVRPALLVADEPVSHQNRAWAEAMMGLVADLAAGGTACLLATHDDVAVAAAHRVVHLRDGRLVADGPAPGDGRSGP